MKKTAQKRRRTQGESEVDRQSETPREPNLWFAVAPKGTGLSIEVDDPSGAFARLSPGDALLLADAPGPTATAWGLRRVYLARRTAGGRTVVWFDRASDFADNPIPLPGGAAAGPLKGDISLLDPWLVARGKLPFGDIPPPADTPENRRFVREILEETVRCDLIGPAMGPDEEVVGMNVHDRYVLGRLGPRQANPDAVRGAAAAPDPAEEPAAAEEEEEELAPEVAGNDDHADRDDAPASKVSEEEVDEDVVDEAEAMRSGTLVPSSMGLTFCLDATLPDIEVSVSWGSYRRATSETKCHEKTGEPLPCWKREPFGGTSVLHLTEGPIQKYSGDPRGGDIFVTGSVSAPMCGVRLVTLFLVNEQNEPKELKDAAWVFQPEIRVRAADGVSAVFRKRPLASLSKDDPELKALDMVYRRHVEFAVGHNVSVHVESVKGEPDCATEVRTEIMPRYEVPATEVPGKGPTDRDALRDIESGHKLDMRTLAEEVRTGGGTNLRTGVLGTLVADYATWIGERRKAAQSPELALYSAEANANLAKCDEIRRRLEEGIAVLEKDANARKAFAFANDVMADQRVHTIYAGKRRVGENPDLASIEANPANHSWYPFQIAFLLLAVPALADPGHPNRTQSATALADLLWFPTGGGKTEAYLGAAAFAMAIRRLQGNLGGLDGSRGLSVVMRYTLRLLTVQQFQRASTLVCAMELRRKADEATWGSHPFTLGLWVGNKLTPGDFDESVAGLQALQGNGRGGAKASPVQLSHCPWCGEPIKPNNDCVHHDSERKRTILRCGDPECPFSARQAPDEGIPILVVDDEIYRNPPSMMIATADKFAQMAWNGNIRTLFGYATKECERHGLVLPDGRICDGQTHPAAGSFARKPAFFVSRIRPPDLIIQDEFHLISGPLGTLVGLYESAVDELCAWTLPNGRKAHPKIVASTATVRMADEQMKRVFYRRCAVFPPAGLDVEDNFFSVQRPTDVKSGRLYLGVCAIGLSRPAALIRVYVAFLTAAKALFDGFGKLADPYMTVIGYFNSLRDLGGMRRLAEDDVQTRSYRVLLDHRIDRPGLAQRRVTAIDELTSRVSSKDIPAKLAQLEIEFKENWAKGEARAIDIELATNMLSVGVDVNRLGLMIANGQPKNTAEYIQATSRVGRRHPGVVCTVLAWARPRDFSHYETFEHYHATFYKQVEAQSVTPFSTRALDRGLTGAFVSQMRLADDELAPNAGAAALTSSADPRVAAVRDAFAKRAENVMADIEYGRRVIAELGSRADLWVTEGTGGGHRLVYKRGRGGDGTQVPLLLEPGKGAWNRQTAPSSMREVEGDIRLIMRSTRLPDDPDKEHPWKALPARDNDRANEETED